jgi:hypothetical protein
LLDERVGVEPNGHDPTCGKTGKGTMAMTEAEWLESINAQAMLDCLDSKASPKKLRLFACALLREMAESEVMAAIDVAERLADGHATSRDVMIAQVELNPVGMNYCLNKGESFGWQQAAMNDLFRETFGVREAKTIAEGRLRNGPGSKSRPTDDEWSGRTNEWIAYEVRRLTDASHEMSGILRDIFGNPFRPVALDPAWLTWNNATVPTIAHHIHHDRAYHDMPILADALEDSGCTDPDILTHCRGARPHVRGCWVIDLILGK